MVIDLHSMVNASAKYSQNVSVVVHDLLLTAAIQMMLIVWCDLVLNGIPHFEKVFINSCEHTRFFFGCCLCQKRCVYGTFVFELSTSYHFSASMYTCLLFRLHCCNRLQPCGQAIFIGASSKMIAFDISLARVVVHFRPLFPCVISRFKMNVITSSQTIEISAIVRY